MKTQKTKSEHARAAAAMKAECSKLWPCVKFSATSESFSMGDAARLSWVDGPTVDMVDKIVKKYQYGRFDSMTDCYNFSHVNKDLPQTKYATADRDMSDEAKTLILAMLCTRFGVDSLDYDGDFEPMGERVCVLVRREFYKLDLSK